MPSGKWRTSCLGLNELNDQGNPDVISVPIAAISDDSFHSNKEYFA